MKYKVAITQSIDELNNKTYLNFEYVNLLISNGITPIILPFSSNYSVIDEIIDECDGVVISGGVDINPKRYNEACHETVKEISDNRDNLELHVIDYVIKKDIPLLCICRGMQLLNVYCGGALYQDLPSQAGLNHSMEKPYSRYVHEIKLEKDGMLYRISNIEISKVNSLHHQGIKTLGKNLQIEAKAQDGIIEAVSMKDKRFVLGVQYHPDFIFEFDTLSNLIIKEFKNKMK